MSAKEQVSRERPSRNGPSSGQRERQELLKQASAAAGPKGSGLALESLVARARALQHRVYLERAFDRWKGPKSEEVLVRDFLATIEIEQCCVESVHLEGYGIGVTYLVLRLGAGTKQVALSQDHRGKHRDAGLVISNLLILERVRGHKRILFMDWNEKHDFAALADALFAAIDSRELPVAKGLSPETRVRLLMRLLVPWDTSQRPGYNLPGATRRALDGWFRNAEMLYAGTPDEALRQRLIADRELPFAPFESNP